MRFMDLQAAWAERLAKAIAAAQEEEGERGMGNGEPENVASDDLIISP